MNRKNKWLTSRQSSPSRSSLDTSNWYNALYKSIANEFNGYNEDVKLSIEERKETYLNDNNFSRFMDAANADEDEFLKIKAFEQDNINNIDEIIVTPKSTLNTKEEKNQQRNMLLTKKWLSGITGEQLTDDDKKELDELDRWHSIIYNGAAYKNNYKPYEYVPRNAQERAEMEAKDRIRKVAEDSPKGYWLRSALRMPYMGLKLPFVMDPFGIEKGLDWITDAIVDQIMPDADKYDLADDLATSFHRKVNEVQVDDSKGKIQRVQEMQLLAQSGLDELLDEISKTDAAKLRLGQLRFKNSRQELSQEEVEEMQSLQQRIDMAPYNELLAERKLSTLSQYESFPIIGQAWEKANWFLNKINFAYDLGVRDDLTGLRNKLYILLQARKSGDMRRIANAIENLKAQLDNFNKNSQKAIEGWTKDIDTDKKQIEDIDKKYKVSSYYEANDQLAQDLFIFSPKKILFSTAGLLGSSMSHIPSQVIKTGTILASLFTGTAPEYLGAAAVNVIAGGAGASSENNAEVGGTLQVSDFVQSLYNHGIEDVALKEGRELLGNQKATLNDVIEAFTEGRISFANRNVRNTLLNTIAGANQQWAYDMNATAPGVWTDAALTTIPDAAYAKIMKFGKSLTPKALRQQLNKANGIFGELVEESNVGLNAIPAEEIANAAKIASRGGAKDVVIIPLSTPTGITNVVTRRAAEETAEQLRDKVTLVTKLASYLPEKFLRSKTIQTGTFIKSVSSRSIVGMGEEFWEEDVQSIRQHQRADGEYTSDFIIGMYNPRLILDNILSGVRSSWDFIFKDPLHATQDELEIWREAKLGALGFLAQGGIPVIVRSSYDTWKQYSADDVALTNIRATKAEDDALIEKGILFARNAKNQQDYQRMMRAFDDIESANRARNERSRRTNNQDDAGFPEEFMSQNKELYQKIYNLYHSSTMQNAAINAGIDVDSEDYSQFISIMARQADIYRDAVKNHNDQQRYIQNLKTVAESNLAFTKWLEDNNLLYTRDRKQKKSGKGAHPITEKRREELRKQYLREVEQKFQLAELGAVVELYEQYSAIAQQTQRQSETAKAMKDSLDELNERRKKAGQREIKTSLDVNDLVKDAEFHNDFKSEYAKLYGFVTDSNMANDIWLDALEGKEVVENGKRKRIYTGKRLVDRYKQTSKSDRDFLETLEKDFFNTIKRRRDISQWFKDFKLTDTNNVYTGFDGKQYVAKPVELDGGLSVVAKYELGPSGDSVGNPMYFDEEEFYTYHEMALRDLEKETSEDSSDDDRLLAGKNRLNRKRYQDRYNRAQEIKILAAQDEELLAIAESYQLQKSQAQIDDEARAQAELEQLQIDLEQEKLRKEQERLRQQENDLILAQMEDREPVEQRLPRPERLFSEGWNFKTRKTKRGGTYYFAEKDGKEIKLTKSEWSIGADLLAQIQENLKLESFLSGRIEDYEHDEASYKGVPGSHNAVEELVIRALNAAYSGYEGTFAELLHQASFVLTDEQLDDLRLAFAQVNGYFAKEWAQSSSRDAVRSLNDAHNVIQNAILKCRSQLFKFYRLISQYSDEDVQLFVEDFTKSEQYSPQGSKTAERSLFSKKQGISKALWLIGLVKTKFHLQQKGNKYYATSPTGERHKLTKLEYSFALFMKTELQPKQQLFNFEDPIDSNDSEVFEKDYSKFEASETAKQSPLRIERIPQLLQDAAFADDTKTAEQTNLILNLIGSIISSISSRSSATQKQIFDTLFQYDKELNPDILHDVTSKLHYFIVKDGKVTPYERVHTYLSADRDFHLGNSSSIYYADAIEIRDAILNTKTFEEFVNIINKYQNRWNDELAKTYPIGTDTFKNRCINLAGYTFEDIYSYYKDVAANAVANIAAIGKIEERGVVRNVIPLATQAVDAGNVVDKIARLIFSNKPVQNEVEFRMSDEVFRALVQQIQHKKDLLERVGIKVLANEICTFAEIDGRMVAGVMDMLAIDKFGNVYIVDFKTTSSQTYFEKAIKGPYRSQLTVYSRLLETLHSGLQVKGLYVAPVRLTKRVYTDPVTGKRDNNVYAGIESASVEKVIKIEPNPQYLGKTQQQEPVPYEEIDGKLNYLKTRFNSAYLWITGTFGTIPAQLQQDYAQILKSIQDLDAAVNDLKSENAVPEDALLNEITIVASRLDDFAQKSKDIQQQTVQQQSSQEPTGGIPNTPTSHDFVAEDKGPTGELLRYNNIDVHIRPYGMTNKTPQENQKWEDFKRVTAFPDFIESSVWTLNVSHYIREMGTLMNGRSITNPTILVTIEYTEHKEDGSIVNHTFGNLMLQVAQQTQDGTLITNLRTQNPLILKIDSILFDRDDNGNLVWKKDSHKIKVVLKGKSRTNGKLLYNSSKRQSIDKTFNLRPEEIEGLMNDGGNSIGEISVIVNGSPNRILKSGDQRNRIVIYNIPEGRGLSDGIMAIVLKLPYKEDRTPTHLPVIPLTPKTLHNTDVDLIMDILSNISKYARSYKINIDGKLYQSPIDVWKILSSLIRFGESARQTRSRFIFDFAKENGLPNHNIVEMTQYGTENVAQYDLRIPEQKEALRKEIEKATVYYNNEYLLRHGTSTKLDSTDNLFRGLQKFFEDHPDIDKISYSESMTFDRSDIDPDGDGSFKGITGFHWMVNHGWFLSDYVGIELPLMSATDAENRGAAQEELKPKETPKAIQEEQKNQESGFFHNDIEEAPVVLRDNIANNGIDDPTIGPINLNEANDISALYDDDPGTKLFKTQIRHARNKINREQAERRIRKILGKNFPVRFTTDIIQALSNGHIVVGQLNKQGIILSDAAENGVEFHEAFHGVLEILLPDSVRERIYKHYREKYSNGRALDSVAVAEGLADLYYEFKQQSPEIRLTWNIAKLFKNVSDYTKALYNLNDAKMSALFLATDTGLMKLFKSDNKKFDKFEKRFSNGLNYEIVRRTNVDGEVRIIRTPLKHFGNQKSVDDLIEVLLYKLIHDSGVETLGTNLKRLDTRYGAIATTLMATSEERNSMEKKYIELKPKYGIDAWDHIEHSKAFKVLTGEGYTDEQLKSFLLSGKISPLAYRNTMMFREAFEKWDVFRELVEKQLAAKAVDFKIRREDSQVEDSDGGEGFNQEEFGHYDQPFYEHSMRDDVPTRIKFFLSTRPNRRFATKEDVDEGRVVSTHVEVLTEEGKKLVRVPVDVKNNSLGYSTYASYLYVYNLLLKTVHKAKTVGELDKMLEKLGESDFILYSIGKNFHRFRRLSYVRYQSEDGGKYRNIPKVTVKGKLLSPSEYISNFNNLTEDEEFPTVVRYTHDIVDSKTSKLLHRQGEIIQDAIIQTNPDYELLVAQLFQAIHAQKLDFLYAFASLVLQEDGKPTGRYTYRMDSTNSDQSMQAYPHIWFDSLRSGWGGIFGVDSNGNPIVNKEGGKPVRVFGDAAIFLRTLRGAVSAEAGKINAHNIPINGKYYDMNDPEGFDEIETEFIKVLNSVGVEVNKQSLNYMLLQKYPEVDNISQAFVLMMTSRTTDSISPFIDAETGVLDVLQRALDTENLSVFMNDSRGNNNSSASGSFLYGLNGFLKSLASWDGKYRLASQETMTLGPDNTKMYTYAQHHSASEDVDSLNNVFDKSGNMIQSGLVWDLKQSPYVISEDGTSGSIVIRNVLNLNFNPRHDRLVLSTSAGVKLNVRGNYGTKYSEISAAEDWLSKAAILQDGHIIFPTLSDKSTWFFLRGVKLPGFDYNNILFANLPLFAHTGGYGRMIFSIEDWSNNKLLLFSKENPILDQLIEYAYRELALVNQTINQLGILNVNQTFEKHLEDEDKIENFHTKEMHGARFCFLTGVYGKYIDRGATFELDESVDEFYDFNRYDEKNPEKSVLESRERAMRVFFDLKPGETQELLRARLRAMIANILQHRMVDLLNDLVDKGIIERIPKNEYKFSKNNGQTKRNDKLTDFFGFKNKYLDDSNIKKLINAYKSQPYQNRTYGEAFTETLLESIAISAYVYDILAKSIISKEETLRIFTGFPHFFEWKFDEDGKLVDILQDESKRHGGEGSTGTSNILDLANLPSTYRCAEIKDHKISSHIAKALSYAFKDNEYRDALANKKIRELEAKSDEEVDKIYDEVYSMNLSDVEKELGDIKSIIDRHISDESSSFSEASNKSADGTAYITDKMAENLLRMRGAYNSEIQTAFEYLRGNKKNKRGHLNSSKAYKTIMNSLIGAQKYSAYGYRMQNGLPVHFYNKYALFPIFEDVAYGITKILYDKMNDPKNGVDMVMMVSAVKVGSQASLAFNPDMTIEELNNFSFKDRTYVLPYSRIRRQLNTDPHEREKMNMGTLAVKVALSTIRDGQLYTRPDGSTIRGRDLKNNIMRNINQLATLGEKKIVDRFFKDGVLDMTEFAKFAEDLLLDRNADKNILDAVRSLYTNPSAILNSVSNMAWIESIMVSMINKNVIDINLPGNAFYQRSVFGMEGILGDAKYILNGGKKLQMINEEGSMDAVVSLDFFYNIIPAEYKYNFNKAKQWLIDNNIISGVRSMDTEWHNASANIVAYRIPTQAVSSIHALRIVDIVPDLRDTIILPEEFTTITGSDFDIDKLYCSMLNYSVSKFKYQDVLREGGNNIEYEATSSFDKNINPEEYYQNQLLNDYLMLLKDAGRRVEDEVNREDPEERNILGRYIHMLHRSIDNDTDLIKRVLKKVEAGQKRTPVEPFVAGSLYTLSNLKDSFITGKFGIGPYALNNNSLILTTLYNVSFKESLFGILSALNATSLHEYTDRDGNSIMGWMSALINAHVDVAKDPYILRLNVNKYTHNLVSLLIRTGFGKDALYFVDQPILKRLAVDYQNANGDVVDDPSLSPTARSRAIEKEIAQSYDYGTTAINTKIKKLYGSGNNTYTKQDFLEDIPIIKALFGIQDGAYIAGTKTILEDLLTNKDLLIDKNGGFTVDNYIQNGYYDINGTKYSPRILQGYVFIAKKMFDEYAEALGNLVQTTKIDTKKHGISFLEQKEYEHRYNELSSQETNMFDENLQNMLKDSFIEHKTRLAIGDSRKGEQGLLQRLLSPQLIHFTPRFQQTVDVISNIVNNRTIDTKLEIQRQLLAYIKQKCMNRIMDERGISFDDIMRGPNNLALRITALKRKMLSDSTGKYSHFASYGVITNSILNNIHAVPYIPAFGQDRYSLLLLDNSIDDDPDIENSYIDSWLQMWESDDEEVRKIALDLAVYAFLTSADNRGFTKFFKYVPLKMREDIGYVRYMNEMYMQFANGDVSITTDGHSFNEINVNEFLRNNWQSNKIIPIYNPYTKSGQIKIYGHRTMYQDENKANGMPIYRNTWQMFTFGTNKQGKPFLSPNLDGLYPPFLKMHRPFSTSRDSAPYLLYKLVNVVKKGEYEFPVYALATLKGVSIKAGSQTFNIYEYDRSDSNPDIMAGMLLDDIDWNEVSSNMVDFFAKKATQNPNFRVTSTLFEKMARNPKTGQDIKSYKITTDKDTGKQTVVETVPTKYTSLLQDMWRTERDIRRIERSSEGVDKSQLRYNDRFMKFCKST